MQLVRGLHQVLPIHQGCAAAIGNFDGVHLGHQALLNQLKMRAKSLKTKTLVITFEPQPLEFFVPERPIPRLTRLREKFYALQKCDIDYMLVIYFNRSFAILSAENFIQEVLIKKLAVKHMIVGEDFRFGHERQGNIALLQKSKEFTTETMKTILRDEERISSTRVRQALANGDLESAKNLLGRPYTMMGRIVHGDKLGRRLGFPTANILLHRQATPLHGIYAVYLHGIEEKPLPGVANIGTRPTIGGTRTLLEVHLLNFDADIYHRDVTIEFCKKFREEVRYENLSLLKEAIARDVKQAKEYFYE